MAVPMTWWLRLFLIVGTLEATAIGASGLFAPEGALFHHLLPITVSQLNGRVIGAFYLAGAVGLALSLLSHDARDTRLYVIGFGLIAGSLLLLTLHYWDEFTIDRVPYGWLASYVVDPLLAALAITQLRLTRPAEPGRHRLTPLFIVQGLVLGGAGALLLFTPQTAIAHAPWTITVVLARVYASFFFGFATGAWLAAWERRPSALLPFTASSFALLIFALVASLQHRDRFVSGAPQWIWFVSLVVGAVLFAAATVGLRVWPTYSREQAHPARMAQP